MISGTARSKIPLLVDDERCQRCATCLAKAVCRGSAIRILDRDEAPFLDMSRCWGCLQCLPACPFAAVVRRDETASRGVP